MASQALKPAYDVFGDEAVEQVLAGGGEGAGRLTMLIEMADAGAEVGTKLLMSGAPQPVERRLCVRAVAALAVAALRRTDDSAEPIAAAVAFARMLWSGHQLTRRVPREAVAKAVRHVAAALAVWLPSAAAFDALRSIARQRQLGPTAVLAALCDACAAADVAECAAVAAYVVAVHGICGDDGPGCTAASVRAMAEAAAGHDSQLLQAAAAAAGGQEAGFEPLRRLPPASAQQIASQVADRYGCSSATVAPQLRSETTAVDSSTAGDSEATAEELGFAPARLSLSLLLRGIMQSTRTRGEPLQHFLNRLTHLALSGKGVDRIVNLHLCTNLRTVYLDENRIEAVDDGLAPCRDSLTHLYLQGNVLRSLDGCAVLQRLTKLYVVRNQLQSLRGVEGLPLLQELHASQQQHGDAAGFSLEGSDGGSVFEGMKALTVLKLAAVGLPQDQLRHLPAAAGLRELDLQRNDITSAQCLGEALGRLHRLGSINVAGNPLTRQAKWRDCIVIEGGGALQSIDGQEVTQRERQFLRDLARRRSSGRLSLGGDDQRMPRRSSAPGLEVGTDVQTTTEAPALPALPARALRRASSGQSLPVAAAQRGSLEVRSSRPRP
eukprot:TRINITY_DN36248_c0_g1_i1.p1 TRINITY_DN36248_c0_g1~~TRINITY_DN36248_c0_g1_i1.p1  ORF type:complete len:607 (+),score=203.51 TRINITY_DN36248_c0_g1_i1:55-1875(+)